LSKLHNLYQELKQDERYQEQYKAEQAWNAYEKAKDRIVADKEKAREALAKQARSAQRSSTPVPQGEAITTQEATRLVASQNEASRVVRKIERAQNVKGPLQRSSVDILREEYGKGLEVGGTHGGAICRGVLAAADELGIDTDSVVDPFRKERHRESLERAQHASRLMDLISSNVPEPPFARPG